MSNGTAVNPLLSAQVIPASITLFQVNGAAAALNQDGMVNSPQNPAQLGSTVMLFGTGGGQTNPPNVEGEITPLDLRPLLMSGLQGAILTYNRMGSPPGVVYLTVQYAGAAPTLISGVTQVNVTLPSVIPAVAGWLERYP
jgi:uncharacterized protein (TIGR03437 family)